MRAPLSALGRPARSPVGRLAPPVRIGAVVLLFVALLVAPAARPDGAVLLAAVVLAWVAACRPPARFLGRTLLIGVVLFAPYLLLAPLVDPAPGDDRWFGTHALWLTGGVVLRGFGGLLLFSSAFATLDRADLREGLARLPLPPLAGAILVQIAHQTDCLLDESRRVTAAVAVRGASRGFATGVRVLASLPRVWIPRVAERAERVGSAMELRGYAGNERLLLRRTPAGLRGAVALGAGVAAVVAGAWLRWGVGP
jgi:energy-coupling factor transporter transmembrane protein EcfT